MRSFIYESYGNFFPNESLIAEILTSDVRRLNICASRAE